MDAMETIYGFIDSYKTLEGHSDSAKESAFWML